MKIHKCLDFIVVKGKIQTSFCLRVQTRLANIHKNEFIGHDRKSGSEKTLKIKCKKEFFACSDRTI